MNGAKAANKWLYFAKEDLDVARITLKEQIFNQVCFHSHQCVEKCLKALLRSNNQAPPKIHALIDLLELCIAFNPSLVSFELECKSLDRYYIPVRYPEAPPGSLPSGLPGKADADEALKIATKIFDFVRGLVGLQQAQPG